MQPPGVPRRGPAKAPRLSPRRPLGRGAHRSPPRPSVDLTARVGSVVLPSPIMCASGTAGYGAELAAYLDLSALGAVVVKSLSAEPWAGNPAPRVHETDAGMLNSVGLHNPGVEHWLADELPALAATGARVVASIWGRSVEEYAAAARMLGAGGAGGAGGADVGTGHAEGIVALEVNLSCPNLGRDHVLFAHSPEATGAVVAAVAEVWPGPVWAKLSPNTADLVAVAGAALGAGAASLTLVNTVAGMAIDPVTRRPRLGAGSGGLSGPAIRPVAVRAVFECRRAFRAAAIVGVGGVARGVHAAELLVAGADAVQVGTATFADPRAAARVASELEDWCSSHGVARLADLVGSAHA